MLLCPKCKEPLPSVVYEPQTILGGDDDLPEVELIVQCLRCRKEWQIKWSVMHKAGLLRRR